MRYAPIEKWIFSCCLFVCMRVERIAGKFGKVLNVLERNLTRISYQCVAYLKLFKRFAKWMHTRIGLISATNPAMANRRQRFRRTLNRGSLHVVQYTAYAAHFLATSGTSRAAMDEMRKRGAVSGRLRRTMAIDDDHAAMIGGGAEYQFAGDVVIIGNDRSNQAAFTEPRQFNRFVKIVVRKHRTHGSECLDRMYCVRRHRFLAVQQRRHEKRAFGRICIDDFKVIGATVDYVRLQ